MTWNRDNATTRTIPEWVGPRLTDAEIDEEIRMHRYEKRMAEVQRLREALEYIVRLAVASHFENDWSSRFAAIEYAARDALAERNTKP